MFQRQNEAERSGEMRKKSGSLPRGINQWNLRFSPYKDQRQVVKSEIELLSFD